MFTNAGTSSFTQFLSKVAPELLPGRRPLPPGLAADIAPHATTIVAITSATGVVMAGDRRATMGNMISSRDIQKVHPADRHSLVGIAGTAGIGIEMMRLFQVELEHYEKIEGAVLSLDGKANRLASMIRGNLGAAMQGLAVIPLFAGFDLAVADPAKAGRIFSFDVAGGPYEETGYDAIGSGSLFARSALKKRYRPGSEHRRGGPPRRRGALRRGGRRHRHRWPGPHPPDLPGGDDGHGGGHQPAHRVRDGGGRRGRRRRPDGEPGRLTPPAAPPAVSLFRRQPSL